LLLLPVEAAFYFVHCSAWIIAMRLLVAAFVFACLAVATSVVMLPAGAQAGVQVVTSADNGKAVD
jgi:hypothetical protein